MTSRSRDISTERTFELRESVCLRGLLGCDLLDSLMKVFDLSGDVYVSLSHFQGRMAQQSGERNQVNLVQNRSCPERMASAVELAVLGYPELLSSSGKIRRQPPFAPRLSILSQKKVVAFRLASQQPNEQFDHYRVKDQNARVSALGCVGRLVAFFITTVI